MVCCCRKEEAFEEFESPKNSNVKGSSDAAVVVKSMQMDRRVDNDDDDDGSENSDKQAVRWIRNRSLEKIRSSSSEKTPSPPFSRNVSQSPTPSNDRSKSAPVDLDGYIDMYNSNGDSSDECDDQVRLDSQVERQAEEPAKPVPVAPKPEIAVSPIAQTASDIEAQIKYEEACRLLHKTLIEKQDKLTPSEHSFLDELVTSIDSTDNTNIEHLSDVASNVESAAHVLATNPLFQENGEPTMESRSISRSPRDTDLFPDDPMSLSFTEEKDQIECRRSPMSSSSSDDELEGNGQDNLFPDDPMASVGSQRSSLSSNSDQAQDRKSWSLQDGAFPVSSTEGIEVPIGTNEQWWDFGSREQAPVLVDDDPVDTPNKRRKKEVEDEQDPVLVRFDGWANINGETGGPFRILGTSIDDEGAKPHVLSPLLMEALRGFLPFVVSEENFWLKYSLARDGASLGTLLNSVRASVWTVIGIETLDGDVFGAFTGSPWRIQPNWFGTGQAFLWRLKNSRFATRKEIRKKPNFDSEMEVYPYTGADTLVQFCTHNTLAVGGGDWSGQNSPHRGEPQGIGLQIDGDLQGGETNSCATFANPRLCKNAKRGNEFDISNLEVWTLTPCTSVEEAAKLELRKLFVEEHRSI